MTRKAPFYPTLLLLLAALVGGCESNKSMVGGLLNLDTDLKINFVVDADINPDEQGVASPLFVRMYELKSAKGITKADFVDLFERDKTVLGADMIGDVHRLKRFTPGENRTEQFVLDENTQYVALYAEFSDFQDSNFKLVMPVVINNIFRNSAVVEISGNSITLVE